MYGYFKEKLHANHFWELKDYIECENLNICNDLLLAMWHVNHFWELKGYIECENLNICNDLLPKL